MNTAMKRTASTHPLLTFYVLAFAISWLGWVPLLASSFGMLPELPRPFRLFLILPACGPALAAYLTRRLAGTRPRTSPLPHAAVRFLVSGRWYLLALAIPGLLLLATRAACEVLCATRDSSIHPGSVAEVLGTFVVSVLANPWEEVGWRGFALPILEAKTGIVVASLVVGAISGVWHLPLFVWPESPMSAYPYAPWLVGTVTTSVMIAWLYNASGRSLAVAALYHIALNTLSTAVGIRSFYVYAGVSVLFAGALLALGRRLDGSVRTHPHEPESPPN